MKSADGVVYLVGAGPGDPGLLTCRGRECLARADVLVYDGLVSVELLSFVSSSCETIYAGKKGTSYGSPLTQEAINSVLVDRASKGNIVVRLKGGDPFVFGRGAEECLVLRKANIRFEVVPGVSAATAATAYAGIPLTARGLSSSAVFLTGHLAQGAESEVDWEKVAGNQTLVLFMAWKNIASCVEGLLSAGRAPDTPAAIIRWGTTASQQTVLTSLEHLPRDLASENLLPPILIVLGEVVTLRAELTWFESKPLFGRRVLLTRAPSVSSDYIRELREAGAQLSFAQCTEIGAVTEQEHREIVSVLKELSIFNWLFFTSANAVRSLFAIADSLQMDARNFSGLQIAAVGQATARALSERGLRPDLLGSGKSGEELATALVSRVADDDTCVLFPRARQGRSEPTAVFTEANVRCEVLPVYSTEVAVPTNVLLLDSLAKLESGDIDVAVFFAPSQVHALIEISPKAVEWLSHLPVLAAIGKTTAAALAEYGLTQIIVPKTPNGQALTLAVVSAITSLAD